MTPFHKLPFGLNAGKEKEHEPFSVCEIYGRSHKTGGGLLYKAHRYIRYRNGNQSKRRLRRHAVMGCACKTHCHTHVSSL